MDIDHIWFIHSLVDGHLGCFHLLDVMNSTAVNTLAQLFVGVLVFNYLGYATLAPFFLLCITHQMLPVWCVKASAGRSIVSVLEEDGAVVALIAHAVALTLRKTASLARFSWLHEVPCILYSARSGSISSWPLQRANGRNSSFTPNSPVTDPHPYTWRD